MNKLTIFALAFLAGGWASAALDEPWNRVLITGVLVGLAFVVMSVVRDVIVGRHRVRVVNRECDELNKRWGEESRRINTIRRDGW